MEFEFSSEQLAVCEMARRLFEKESPPSRLRELWGGATRDRAVWKALGDAGLLGIMVPAEFDGVGGDEVDMTLVLEEAGRAALSEPLVETAAVAAPLLAEAGTKEQKEAWLPLIAAGEAIVAVQLAGAPFVADAAEADLLICRREGALHAVPRDGITARPVRSEDGARRLAAVEVHTTPKTHMTGDAGAAARATDRGAAATAAVLNGIAIRMLEMTVEYVRTREQFGRPVGSFQAVKHKLASAFVRIESSRAAAWYAAYAIASRLPDASVAASAAKVVASESESLMNTEALQCHGGIGFTWEHDLHMWMKRGKSLESSFGTAAEHRARVAEHALAAEARSDA